MVTKMLSSERVKVLVLALMGYEPDIRPATAPPITVDIQVYITTSVSDGNDLESKMYITRTNTSTGEKGAKEDYRLLIGYNESTTGKNPYMIGFGYISNGSLMGVPIGNVPFVTQKLKEYGIW